MEVGDVVGVGVEGFFEGEAFAGVFFHRFAGHLQWRFPFGGSIVRDHCGDVVPVREAGGEFVAGRLAVEGQFKDARVKISPSRSFTA